MRRLGIGVVVVLGVLSLPAALAQVVNVANDAALRAAVSQARPGTHIRIAPGNYRPGVSLSNRQGTRARPIVIEGADPERPPVFRGGGEAWHLSDCAYLILRNIAVDGQSSNGINVDDGGSFDTPTHHIRLEGIRASNIGPRGNHDPIKLSGLDDFAVVGCTFDGWGGQAVDMVGCHRGLIEDCTFIGRKNCSQSAGPQTKGGTSRIVIRDCVFQNAASRGVNIGGSTGLQYFRPLGTKYEAKDIRVENCVFVGCMAPVAYVGVDGGIVRNNTFYCPDKWVMRILQETTSPGFAPCRNGVFEKNLIVFRSNVRTFVNVGPNTQPQTFKFADNWWYCEDRPQASRPNLPTPETNGVYGVDPKLTDPANDDFLPKETRAKKYGKQADSSSAK